MGTDLLNNKNTGGKSKQLPFVHLALLFLFLCVCSTPGFAARLMAFQRNDGIYVADIDGTKAAFVCKGNDPDISPDGTQIAYTHSEGDGRFIAVYDLRARTVRVLRQIPGTNSYGPHWSGDGKKILFNHFAADRHGRTDWKIGVVAADGSTMRLLRGNGAGSEYSPAWRGADQVVFQDMKNLLVASLDGTIVKTIPFVRLGVPDGASSAMHFVPSADGKKILFDADVVTDPPLADGLPSAVFIYNVVSGSRVRVTPLGLCALSPRWLSDNEIIFEGYGNTRDIFSIKGDGTGLRKIIGNAGTPSCSLPDQP
jgi:Tol biopolymer transport system component